MPIEIAITMGLVILGSLCWAVLIFRFHPVDTSKPPKKADGPEAQWYWEQTQKVIEEQKQRSIERHITKDPSK